LTVDTILIVSDARTVIDDVRSVLDEREVEIVEIQSGEAVRAAVDYHDPDLVVTDFQVGNMGAMAICLDLRLEESGGRLPHVPVLMLCDRRADVFLAKRSSAEGYIVKPLDPIRLRRAIRLLLDGEEFHDESYKPMTTTLAPAAPTGPFASAGG
jgi:DNA-binding response OmpR family regulator